MIDVKEAEQLLEKFIQKTGGFAKDATLRDYFAANAMQGVVSGLSIRGEPLNYRECALFSYELADTMLKAREV